MIEYRKIILLLILVLLVTAIHFDRANAIGPRTIEGRVYDEEFNPLAGIRVLLSVDGQFIVGAATDQTGWFILEFESGISEICFLNILSKNHQGLLSEVVISDDTTYVEFSLKNMPFDRVYLRDTSSPTGPDIPPALTRRPGISS